MRWLVGTVVLVALLLSGCGSGSRGASTAVSTTSSQATNTITADGVYEVGKDIPAGVYLAGAGTGCVGFSASRPDYKLDDATDLDGFLAGTARVGDKLRIELHRGEFFNSLQCDGWQREDPAAPTTPDPATLAGGCEILVGGDDLLNQVVAYLHKAAGVEKAKPGYQFQDALSALVQARNAQLGDAAGQLVDAMDDPSAYVDADGTLSSKVARALDRIRTACKTG